MEPNTNLFSGISTLSLSHGRLSTESNARQSVNWTALLLHGASLFFVRTFIPLSVILK